MNQIDKFIQDKLTLDEQATYLEGLLSDKFDKEYKDKWARKLEAKGVSRTTHAETPDVKNSTTYDAKSTKRMVLILFAIGILLGLGGYYYLSKENIPKPHFADRYLTSDIFKNPAIIKGASNTYNEAYISAAASFNKGDWDQAKQKFSLIAEKNPESDAKFFVALSHFYGGNFSDAIAQFSTLHTSNLDDARKQEVHWFYGLSLYHNGQKDKAQDIWSHIKKGEWKYEVVNQ